MFSQERKLHLESLSSVAIVRFRGRHKLVVQLSLLRLFDIFYDQKLNGLAKLDDHFFGVVLELGMGVENRRVFLEIQVKVFH